MIKKQTIYWVIYSSLFSVGKIDFRFTKILQFIVEIIIGIIRETL